MLHSKLTELTFQLREEKNNVLSKEKEIKALKLRVRNQDVAWALAAAENLSLREQLEQREEEVCDLRCAAETFDAEKTMAVNGAIVVGGERRHSGGSLGANEGVAQPSDGQLGP